MTKLILVLISFYTFSFSVNAQKNLSTNDSIKLFYQSFFDLLKNNHVFKDSVNWDSLEEQTNKRLLTYKTMAASINEVSSVLLKIGDFHSKLFYKGSIIQAKQINFPKNLFSSSWLDKFETKPSFEVKVLDSNYGYVLMPAINNPGNLDFDKVTQDMYDKIWTIKKKQPLKGWIIDLRFNTGGTCIPMLLSLYDFLEKRTIWNTVDNNSVLIENIEFQKGKYISN
jgi:carboxyl-terminal processing protease